MSISRIARGCTDDILWRQSDFDTPRRHGEVAASQIQKARQISKRRDTPPKKVKPRCRAERSQQPSGKPLAIMNQTADTMIAPASGLTVESVQTFLLRPETFKKAVALYQAGHVGAISVVDDMLSARVRSGTEAGVSKRKGKET